MTIPDENGWISVDDALPPYLDNVLLLFEFEGARWPVHGFIDGPIGGLSLGAKINVCIDDDFLNKHKNTDERPMLTHWRPLDFPKPSWEKDVRDVI